MKLRHLVRLSCFWLLIGQTVDAQPLHDYVPPPPRQRRRGPSLQRRSHPDRSTKLQPDRKTDRYAQPGYRPVFDPSVFPFKRGMVYDQVEPDGRLSVHDSSLRLVPILSRPPGPDWTRFDATIRLDRVLQHMAIPIPSVAPRMLISKVTVTPHAGPVRILKDSADNYFAEIDPGGLRPTTLHMTCWAPNRYFGGPLPRAQNRSRTSSTLLPPVISDKAAKVLSAIGFSASTDDMSILRRLVSYFRSFRPGRLTVATSSTYLDIALSRRGVCRHRAYAFMITALALGIHTRMVTNELHAFVEVKLGSKGWRRIDLGGATATPLAASVRKHRPPPDFFPWPQESTHRKPSPAGVSHPMGRAGLARGNASGTTGFGKPNPIAVQLDISGRDDAARVNLVRVHSTGMRGSPVTVTGKITRRRQNHHGRTRIQILLAPLNSSKGYLLGWTSTDASGRFVLRTTIPKTVPVGLYRVVIGD